MSPEMEFLSDAALASLVRQREFLREWQLEIRMKIRIRKGDRVSEHASATDGMSSEKRPRDFRGIREARRGSGCGPGRSEWKARCRYKSLIFRRLSPFFTLFHPYFTPFLSQKGLIFRGLGVLAGVNCAIWRGEKMRVRKLGLETAGLLLPSRHDCACHTGDRAPQGV